MFMTYDEFTASLAKYPTQQHDEQIVAAMYCALGLTGEAGEVAEKIKKWHRDDVLDVKDTIKELGDVLYYLTRIANILGYTLEQVRDMNIEKLTDRQKRNVLHGNGDNR